MSSYIKFLSRNKLYTPSSRPYVGIAAVPLAVWFSGRYLDCFAYRIEHFGWIIAVAAVLGMLMAFLSVLWQTLKAARTNPAEALKKE